MAYAGTNGKCEVRNADCGSRNAQHQLSGLLNSQSEISDFEMKNELETRTKRFALSIIQLVGKLPRSKASDVIGYQLLKSGTSIGANYREAARAGSRDDFIHKIGICEKGAAETDYWLELAQDAKLTALTASDGLLRKVQELLAIFVASGRTAKSHR
jgi:four helix bundle protein